MGNDEQTPASAREAGGRDPRAALIETINVRSMSLIILTSIATLYFIDWAQPVLLPLVVAVLISYTLDPLVSGLERIHIARPLGAAMVLLALVGILAAASVPLKQEAMVMLDKIPKAIKEFQREDAYSAEG